jgi:hypothetical protein
MSQNADQSPTNSLEQLRLNALPEVITLAVGSEWLTHKQMRPGPATRAALLSRVFWLPSFALDERASRDGARESGQSNDVRRSLHLGLPVQRFHPALEGRTLLEAATPGHQFTEVSQTSPGDHPRGITGNAKPNRQSIRMSAL